MLDNVFRWNAGAVLRNLREAAIVSLWFPYIGKALIVDLRHDDREGPLVTVDGLMAGEQARMESLNKLRPRFQMPENVLLAPWIGPVRSLESSGALRDLRNRLELSGHDQAVADLQGAYRRLTALERAEAVSLIRGDVQRTRTLYQR